MRMQGPMTLMQGLVTLMQGPAAPVGHMGTSAQCCLLYLKVTVSFESVLA